jgi:hypothetical protein
MAEKKRRGRPPKNKPPKTSTELMKKEVDKVARKAKKLMDKKMVEIGKLEAKGIAVHSEVTSRTSSALLTDVNDYSDPNLSDRTKIVVLARKLRSIEGICSTVADLLADFAITKGRFYSDNEQLMSLLNSWAELLNSSKISDVQPGIVNPVPGLRTLSRKVFDDYITDGDAIFTVFWQTGVKLNEQDSESYFLPVTSKTLDSLSLEIDLDLAKFGIERLTYTFDDAVLDKIKKPKTENDKILRKAIPKEWMKFVNKNEPIVLDPQVTFHVKRNAKDYKPWGESLFKKAFSSVASKRRIQAVDEATIDGLINRFTIFKLGLPDKEKNPAYHIPSGARVENLIEILTQPKRTNAVVWPGPDLEIIDFGPDGKILEFDNKYKQADIDILRALRTSPLLIDGGSSGQSVRDWAAFIGTEVGLEPIRDSLAKIFTTIGRDIAIGNKMQYETLFYEFDSQLLKDEKRVRNFALQVRELGGLSAQTFVEVMGYNFERERNLRQKEQDEGIEELFTNPNRPGITNVKEGRPDITTDDDKTEEKEEVEASSNPLDSVTFYYELYVALFKKLGQEIDRRLEIGDQDFLNMALISSFVQFKQLTESQLKNVFLKQSGGNITKELPYLMQWNSDYIDTFYEDLRNRLVKSPQTFYIDYHRLFLYAQEGFKKAFWLGEIARARIQGKSRAIWHCTSLKSKCIENDGKEFDFDYLVENFPGHPECRCYLEFLEGV